jgi:hypothetical protein
MRRKRKKALENEPKDRRGSESESGGTMAAHGEMQSTLNLE